MVRASQDSEKGQNVGVVTTENNFLKYSERDFESYLQYLVNDKHDFYDRRFLQRVEHQTRVLKRLINLQAA